MEGLSERWRREGEEKDEGGRVKKEMKEGG